ncbi:hypothetical protein DDR33_17975 [Pararcticibacter amylolyticus]|uniref:Bacterial bifunctional deaminase-reductase C-terminal domain-containing protein n=1 Tax=Pararcticibacter amylolyticus TaxID=2173175 RepID=A0A2U2PCQ7_9SPHI|nr:hypothetical protein DDR33_17975 [Pararcticibacter amylolyticus]
MYLRVLLFVNIYRISVPPIVLGKGKPLFEDLKNHLNLKLIKKNVFKSGVAQLIYESERTIE